MNYRQLGKTGLKVSDIVLEKELPKAIKESVEAYTGCIAGASMGKDYLAAIKDAGFQDIEVVSKVSLGTGELVWPGCKC